jgi:hypothetical protein
MKRWATRLHAWVYRRSGGRLLGCLGGQPVLLLQTTGRRSGQTHTTPVQYLADGDTFVAMVRGRKERIRVIAAALAAGDELRLELHPAAVTAAGRSLIAGLVDCLPRPGAAPAGSSIAARLWAGLSPLDPEPGLVGTVDVALVLLECLQAPNTIGVEFELFEAPEIYAGALFFPYERAHEVMQAWHELVSAGLPDEISTWAKLLRFPPLEDIPEPFRGQAFTVIQTAYLGNEAEGAELIRPLRAGASPDWRTFGSRPR